MTILTAESLGIAISLIVTVLGLAALALCRGRLAGTTLLAPWNWTFASLAVAGATASIVSIQPATGWRSQVLYVAGALSFCPLMALLGAKRPQDRAWQFVVLTLFVILLLPSGQALLDAPRASPELHIVWRCFLWALIALGVLNGFGTRFWRSAAAWGAGQAFLLAQYLFTPWDDLSAVVGVVFLAAAAISGPLGVAHSPRQESGWNRVWLDFRDHFGTLWALRVMERFNAAATLSAWNVRLHWSGFTVLDASRTANSDQGDIVEPVLSEGAETSFRGLLRRFVDADWVDARLRCGKSGVALD
jgi:hypothetical protein